MSNVTIKVPSATKYITLVGLLLFVLKVLGVTVGIGYWAIWAIILFPITIYLVVLGSTIGVAAILALCVFVWVCIEDGYDRITYRFRRRGRNRIK